MKVILSSSQWRDYNVDSERDFVRACFYLSLGDNFILSRCKASVFESERQETVRLALELGMCESDQIILGR